MANNEGSPPPAWLVPREHAADRNDRVRVDFGTAFIFGFGFAAGAAVFGVLLMLVIGILLQTSIRGLLGT